MFSFPRSGNKGKRGVKLQHSKWKTECLNTRFSLPVLLYVGYSMNCDAKKIKKYILRRARDIYFF